MKYLQNVYLSAGNGAFGPNKPPIKNIEKFENKSVFYSVKISQFLITKQ